MNAQHTPGPWSVFSIYAETEIRGPQDSGAMIARMVPWGDAADTPDPQRANARLIAAAPDLLAALRDMQELAALLAANCTDRVDVTNDPRVGAARAAIARATGSAE